MRYIIVTGGPLPREASVVIKSYDDACIIGCDSGCDYLAKINIIPDIALGDMDSITDQGLEFIKSNNVFTEVYPIEKDWTDTEIAIGKAEKNDEVVLVCPLSSRIDHAIANLGIALNLRSQGRKITVTDGITSCYPLYGEDEVSFDVSKYEGDAAVSLIPWNFNDTVKGVSSKGLYYPLKDMDLTAGSSFSFSNHPKKNTKKVTVNIKSGMLLVVVTKAI